MQELSLFPTIKELSTSATMGLLVFMVASLYQGGHRQPLGYMMEPSQQTTKKLGMTPSERFEVFEGRLLLISVPLYFVVIVLLIVASTFASVLWVTLPTHLLISLLSVLIAFVLLIKWVAVLRKMYMQAVADRGSDETIAVAIGAACICLLLAGLIVLVAAHAGEVSTPVLVLLVIEPILLIWQYRHIAFGEHEN
jgi:hypothetical protein